LHEIASAIISDIGYSPDIRKIFLSSIHPDFRLLFPAIQVELLQIRTDLENLNRVERLSDGTVPMQLWLDEAARFVKPFPTTSALIQKSLAEVTRRILNRGIENPAPPPNQAVRDKIVKEKIINKDDMVSYAFLQGGTLAGMSVVRIHVPRFDNGVARLNGDGTPVTYLGTGWLLTPDTIITNHHVINARHDGEADALPPDFNLQAEATQVEFEYNTQNLKGQFFTARGVLAVNKDLDYVALKIDQNVNRAPLRIRSQRIDIMANNSEVVNIIQHPLGKAKKVALRNNHIYGATFPKVTYFTDTEGGASGSPVFNDRWEVVALHRASVFVDNVQYNGQKTAWVNEGVQIRAIVDDLSAKVAGIAQSIVQS